MERTYKYTVLTAIPDVRRGERVNIGVVVFGDREPDIRFRHAAFKMRALTGDNWDAKIESAQDRLRSLCNEHTSPEDALERFRMLEPLFKTSSLGWLTARNEADYEARVREIIDSLVKPPRRERVETLSRLNTEVSWDLRKSKFLSSAHGTIEEGRVVKNYPVLAKEGLIADFAQRNGKLNIITTLDLRRQNVSLGDAALKSMVMVKAGEIFKDGVQRIGLYAVEDGMRDHFRRHIDLFGDYADRLLNWEKTMERVLFHNVVWKAILPGGLATN